MVHEVREDEPLLAEDLRVEAIELASDTTDLEAALRVLEAQD
jgi:hypothetical protein